MTHVEESISQRRLPILALVAGAGVSTVGTLMTLIALPWFVLQTTGSVAKTGITTAVWVLPVVLSGALAGPIVDHLGHWRSGVIGDLGAGLCVAAIPTLYHLNYLPFLGLLAVVFMRGLFDFPGRTGRQSLIPEIAELASMLLERANAAFATVRSVALLIGPAIAGVLIARFSASNVMWIDAATYAFSATMTGALVPSNTHQVSPEPHSRYRDQLVAGLRLVKHDRLLMTLLAFTTANTFLTSPLLDVEMPAYVRQTSASAVELGLMPAAYGVGTLGSSLLYAALGDRIPRRAVLLAYPLVTALSLAPLVFKPQLSWCIAVMGVLGLAAGPIGPLYQTVIQERVSQEVRGRVFSLNGVSMAAIPLGAIGFGFLMQELGISTALAVQAGAIFVGGVVLWWLPALRMIDRRVPSNEIG